MSRMSGASAVNYVCNFPHQVNIGSPPLDWRLKTFLCISFDTFPVYDRVVMEFYFDRRLKAKLWDLYVISCCEDMTAYIPTIGVSY